jgi:deoxyribodipyrimidine photo-lyase
MNSGVPEVRVRRLNDGEPNPAGRYVLYWMTSYRRTRFNFALERSAEWAAEFGVGVAVLEALRCDYRWASDRFHRFVLDGMQDNLEALTDRPGVTYFPYVETEAGSGRGLLEELASQAAVVVTDDYPTFFIPAMLAAAGSRVQVRLEAVDSNGLHPIHATAKTYPTAYSFRRYLQKSLPAHLDTVPAADPVSKLEGLPAPVLSESMLRRWPDASRWLTSLGLDLTELPIDHSVEPAEIRGGARAARARLDSFLGHKLARYDEDRNQPDEEAASGLSPYLHFGHISTHEILEALAEHEGWRPDFEGRPTLGKRTGWWGTSAAAEAFLDQLVTWRELGFNMAANRADHREYHSLPEWARVTLADHAGDPRPHLYSMEQLEGAETTDEIWNAAQRQLRREGVIHNYLRMLWGKRILEWTESPVETARVMIEINNRYALDGRDPNSYSGIYWCLGRYDRPWGPERPIFGKIRYMSSKNTARKLRLKEYLERYSAGPPR